MPNKNYIKGRAKEYQVMKELRAKNYDIVFRSAGSHSPIDIIAIQTGVRLIKFIQVKTDKRRIQNARQIPELINLGYGRAPLKYDVIVELRG